MGSRITVCCLLIKPPHCCRHVTRMPTRKRYWGNGYSLENVINYSSRRHHFWHAPLGVRSTKCRHQSPEWMILSHVSCFIYREVIGFQVLLQYCGIITLSWSAYQTIQLDDIFIECLCCGCAGVEEESLHAVWCPARQVSDWRLVVHWPGLWLTVRWHAHHDVSSLPRTEGLRLWSSFVYISCCSLRDVLFVFRLWGKTARRWLITLHTAGWFL